ncbi:MAG: hypothetical protein O3A46_16545 [Candidatus Poribacteria bacterium]|nr:hypothetical protein [Candidatus Poribacteria bacterium]
MPDSWTTAVLIPALALALGWVVRGIVWGQRGAAIAGGIFGLTLAWLFAHPQPLALAGVSAVAFSYGGAMTTEQTRRMTRFASDSATYGWAMFGLTVKGVLWTGLAAVWIGIAAGHISYGEWEILALVIAQFAFGVIGIRTINRPHDPPERIPRFFFSQRFTDDDDKTIPKLEMWGGLLLSYIGVMAYVILIKDDKFAFSLGIFGGAAGLGLPLSQAIHNWGRDKLPFGRNADPWIDWPAVGDAVYGGIAGAMIGLGWWLTVKFGCNPGINLLPTIPLNVGVALLVAWIFYFAASVLYINPIWSLAQVPFVEGLLVMLPIFALPYGPMLYLAGVLAAAASVANIRPYFCGEAISLPTGMLLAVGATIGSLVAGWYFRAEGVTTWLMLVMWFHVGAVVIGRLIPEEPMDPAIPTPTRSGSKATYLNRLGSTAPTSVIVIIGASLLTWLALR